MSFNQAPISNRDLTSISLSLLNVLFLRPPLLWDIILEGHSALPIKLHARRTAYSCGGPSSRTHAENAWVSATICQIS